MSEPLSSQGQQGVQGERGPHGDHGQSGHDGIDGIDGRRGLSGRPAILQTMILCVFMVLALAALGILAQQQERYASDQCLLRREATIHQNNTWDKLTAIEQIPIDTTSAASAQRIKARISVYADAKVVVPNCQ